MGITNKIRGSNNMIYDRRLIENIKKQMEEQEKGGKQNEISKRKKSKSSRKLSKT